MSLRAVRHAALASCVAITCLSLNAPPAGANKPRPGPVVVAQGRDWTPAERLEFYSQDQGSRIMPLVWFEALQQPNGEPFNADSLARYGYLPNPASPTPGLPVGFTVNGTGSDTAVGMTCAACHTRQIVFGGVAYRIDGGPAIVDFQAFLADLNSPHRSGQRCGVRRLRRRRARPLAHPGAGGGAAQRGRALVPSSRLELPSSRQSIGCSAQ
jgi:hypothetical protein